MAIAAREGRLRRNFQGYTDDAAEALIGLGASSIGQLPQGYVQNMPATGEYQRMADAGGLAAVRGIEVAEDDRLRRRVIEEIMCRFAISFSDLRQEFGAAVDTIAAEAKSFALSNQDRICLIEGDRFVITDAGRPFARTIAAVFDSYLANGKGRHSIAV
jgi:oxygen-independent coproporphyrinogen-3 oxidase